MKKKIILSVCGILLIAAVMGALMASKPKNETLTSFLHNAGFKTVPDMTGSTFEGHWEKEYRLYFISFQKMDSFCKQNQFKISQARNYKFAIPEAPAKQLADNYKRIKNELLIYNFFEYNDGKGSGLGDDRTDPTLGKLLFSLSRNEVKGRVLNKQAFRGHAHRGWSFAFSRKMNLERVIKQEVLTRLSINSGRIKHFWKMVKNEEAKQIYIVAHQNSFSEENAIVDYAALPDKIEKGNPFAVIKHRGGWVVLASWGK